MSAAAKLAAFAAALVAVFALAAVAGGAVGPERDGSNTTSDNHQEDAMSTHAADNTETETAADPVRGLAVADNDLQLVIENTAIARNEPTDLRFKIAAADGKTIEDYEVEHEKRMHLIVVRRDGRGFQHLHPELGENGVWSTRVTLGEPGSYRVFADFKRDGEAQTLAADVFVDGEADYRPLPAAASTADTSDGYRVELDADHVRAGEEAELRFTVKNQDGQTVKTEPYLGAGGHLVALREGDQAYLHVHPEGHDTVDFMSEFPSEGRYSLYLQFKHEGRVHTAEFTQEVAR